MLYFSQIKYFLSLLIFLFFGNSAWAYIPQRGNVNLVLSPYYFKNNTMTMKENSSADMPGLGLLVLGDVSDKGSLEIALIYHNKEFHRESGQYSFVQESQVIHATLGYRSWWSSYWSGSFSFFTAYPLGVPTTTRNDVIEPDFKTSATSNSQSGFDLATQYEAWSSGRWAISLEARYSFLLNAYEGEAPDQFGFGVGIRYFLQSRVKRPQELRTTTEN